MAKRKHRPDGKALATRIEEWAEDNGLELTKRNAGIHYRIEDDITGVYFDCWPGTGRYYIVKTSYHRLDAGITERQSELGWLPGVDEVDSFLGRVFYPLDYL